MVAVTQTGEVAKSHALAAARVLEACILGAASPLAAVEAAIAQLEDVERRCPCPEDAGVAEAMRGVLARRGEDHADSVSQLGRNCHLPGSFLSPLHALVSCSSYEDAVRQTIAQGGCNASRTSLVGACFAACAERGDGRGGIPAEWRGRFGEWAATEERARALAAMREA
jgi:hypothetical protein